MLKVSIIVPVFCVEKYLDRCLESLVSQTLKDIEIILVDDGSPDNCPKMCDDWARKDSRIHVVHKKNEGLGLACNNGIEVATGEYLVFCDSDDYVDLVMYETMYEHAVKADADMVYSGLKSIDDAGVIRRMAHYNSYHLYDSSKAIHGLMLDMIASEPHCQMERKIQMSAKAAMYRRSFIVKNGFRFVSERKLICEDLIWNLDLLGKAHKVISLPEWFYFYYKNSNSLSKKLRLDRFVLFKSLREELISRVSKMGLDVDDVTLRANRLFIGYSRFYLSQIIGSSLHERDKIKLVRKICFDEVWNDVWNNYPVSDFPYKIRLSSFCMKHGLYFPLKLMYALKK